MVPAVREGMTQLGQGIRATVTVTVRDGHAIKSLALVVQVGTQGVNVLTGGSGPDVLFGLGGRDTLRGTGGRDVLCGGGEATTR